MIGNIEECDVLAMASLIGLNRVWVVAIQWKNNVGLKIFNVP